jgi:hypothetical protein
MYPSPGGDCPRGSLMCACSREPSGSAEMIGKSAAGIHAHTSTDHAEEKRGHEPYRGSHPPADAADEARTHKAKQLSHGLLTLGDPAARQAVGGDGAAHADIGSNLTLKQQGAVAVEPHR